MEGEYTASRRHNICRVALSEYDQPPPVFEDETVNRMQEAITLFDYWVGRWEK